MKNHFLTDDEAVSPVIATILMVAITLVLVATLYMTPCSDESGQTVTTGRFGETEQMEDGTYKLTVASLSEEKSVNQLKFRLVNESSGDTVFFEYNSHPSSSPYEASITSGDYTLKYTDIGEYTVISTGDYFVVSDELGDAGLDGSYELTVLCDGNEVTSATFNV